MSRHTEGPWRAVRLPDGTWSIDSERVDGIAELDNRVDWRPRRGESGEAMRRRVEADARLIAAAPEMLRVLKEIRDQAVLLSFQRDDVCEAIAQAEGGDA